MYREVLEYIRELGEERDLSPDRQGEVREYMDLLWGKVKRVKEKKIILFMELISV